jgi:UDP-3-O-[3-hydroxymyristoyl] glucosamine N-acyltransferase
MPFLASDIAGWCQGRVDGPDRQFSGLEAMDIAGPDHLTMAAKAIFARKLSQSKAAGAICTDGLDVQRRADQTVIWVRDADSAVLAVLHKLAAPPPVPEIGVHATAVVDPAATLGQNVRIGPHVVIQAGASIGDNTVLMAGVFVGANSRIGADTFVWPNVTIRENCTVGARVILHSGCVIGADGFGFQFAGDHFEKIPHIGTVVIGDDCELGANTCVDRAKFSTTTVGAGSKLDNLVQIGHNVTLGKHNIMVAHTAVGGSSRTGSFLVMGGGAVITDHVVVGHRVQVAGMAAVTGDQPDGAGVCGIPARPGKQFFSEHRAVHALPRLVQTVRDLEQRIAQLERAAKDHLT